MSYPRKVDEDTAYDEWREQQDEEERVSLPVRFSHLRAYGRSAMHGHHARQQDQEPTVAMQRGTALHALVFDTQKVCGYPGSQRRGKEYEAFAAEHSDHVILTMAEFTKARLMADAVRQSKVAEPVLKGIAEKTILFRWMGLDCRATPDVRGDDFLTDVKSSKSADPSQFLWSARRFSYHAQLRFYEHGCEKHHINIRDHWIVCVESEAPHPVTVFHVEPEALEEGEKLLMLWAERFKSCEAAAHFPPYVECTVPLVWPKEVEYEWPEEEAA